MLRYIYVCLYLFIYLETGLHQLRRVKESPALATTLLALAEKLLELKPTDALASKEEDRVAILRAVSSAVGISQFTMAVQSSMFEVLRKAPRLESEP